MRTSLRWLTLLAVALLVGAAGCDSNKNTGGGYTLGTGDRANSGDGTTSGDELGGDVTAGDTATGDTATGDSAAGDSAAGDSAAGDSAAGDSAAGDSNGGGGDIDCSTVGCGAPPICGGFCTAPCGCCDCGAGGFCNGSGPGSTAVNCDTTLGCYAAEMCTTGCAVEPTSGKATCSGAPLTCSDVQGAYAALTALKSCNVADDCHALAGHCGIGLGGCWEAVNVSVSQTDLDALGSQFNRLGCIGPVCFCIGPPTRVECPAGVCTPVW